MISRKNDMKITSVKSTLKDIKKEKKHKKSIAAINEHEREVSKILKVFMIIMPIIMVGILVMGIWMSVSNYIKENPLEHLDKDAPESLTYSDNSEDDKQRIEKLEYLFRTVDSAHPVDDTYKVEVASYKGTDVNSLMLNGFKNLLSAAENEGFNLVVDYGYITAEEQQAMYQKKVDELINEKGYTLVRAESIAKDYVAVGGCSEFQTGLLIKVKDGDNPKADFSKTKLYRWLSNNSVDYGFVVRYPQYKKDYTGKDFDATIFRYVGTEHSQKMRTYNMCLEEYFEYAKSAI